MSKVFKWQHEVYGERKEKFIIVPAGRRTGKTQGAAIYACIDASQDNPVLWVDTIYSNIDRYYQRYFKPFLDENDLNYTWNVQKKLLIIGDGYIDFRSADKPESIEGFGYRKIYLNEAGIILQNDYLYTNAILPMMLDYPDSQLVAFGTPKGKKNKHNEPHRFYQLWCNVEDKVPGYYGRQLSSYDNPILDKGNLKTLEAEIRKLDPSVIPQEIYGRFIDGIEGTLVGVNDLNWYKLSDIPKEPEHKLGYIDVASGGLDSTSFVYTENIGADVYIRDVVFSNEDTEYTIPACAALINKYEPQYVQVESNNAGKIFIQQLQKLCPKTSIIPIHNSTNKETRIINNIWFVKEHIHFRDDYETGSEYDTFMKEFLSYNKDKRKNKHDDAIDSVTGVVSFISQYLSHLYV